MSKRISEYITFKPLNTEEQQYLKVYQTALLDCNFNFPDPTSYLGIEVEVEGLKPAAYLPYDSWCGDEGESEDSYKILWKQIVDESLRGPSAEFVSIPVRNRMIELAVKQLSNYLKTVHKNHKFSSRCSVHIHDNNRHTSVDNLLKYIITYLVLEPVFFLYSTTYTSFNRKDNNFCIPLKDARNSLKIPFWIEAYKKTKSELIIQSIGTYWSKYTALNLRPLVKGPDYPLGTIEFRHLGGTSDVSVILNWIKMIQNLRLYVKGVDYDDLKNKIFLLNNNSEYASFVHEVLKPGLPLDYSLIIPDIEESVEIVKELYAAADPVEDYEKDLEKVKTTPFFKKLSRTFPGAVSILDPDKYDEYLKVLEKYNAAHALLNSMDDTQPGWNAAYENMVLLKNQKIFMEKQYGFGPVSAYLKNPKHSPLEWL